MITPRHGGAVPTGPGRSGGRHEAASRRSPAMRRLVQSWSRGAGRGRDGQPRGRHQLRPMVLALEGRALLATMITVDNPTDMHVEGKTDLREAIAHANTEGGDTIVFDATV